MNISDFRKNIFINSQYCTHYFDGNSTVFAGMMRDFGYKYHTKFLPEKLKEISNTYRKFTTVINSCIAVEIILYLYFVVFPYFTQLLNMSFVKMAISFSIPPLLALVLTYFIANLFYENYLKKHVGSFQKIKFQPTVDKVDEIEFIHYTKTPKKSVYILLLMLLLFCYYVITPFVIHQSLEREKYNIALNLSNSYIKLIPINPEVYSYSAYALYKKGQYKKAVFNFEMANNYSGTNNFDDQILGLKTYYEPFENMIRTFDEAIEKEVEVKDILLYEKAKYLQKNKKYNEALEIYDDILLAYENGETIHCAPENLYYKRGQVKNILNPHSGDYDINIATNMSTELDVGCESGIIYMP